MCLQTPTELRQTVQAPQPITSIKLPCTGRNPLLAFCNLPQSPRIIPFQGKCRSADDKNTQRAMKKKAEGTGMWSKRMTEHSASTAFLSPQRWFTVGALGLVTCFLHMRKRKHVGSNTEHDSRGHGGGGVRSQGSVVPKIWL